MGWRVCVCGCVCMCVGGVWSGGCVCVSLTLLSPCRAPPFLRGVTTARGHAVAAALLVRRLPAAARGAGPGRSRGSPCPRYRPGLGVWMLPFFLGSQVCWPGCPDGIPPFPVSVCLSARAEARRPTSRSCQASSPASAAHSSRLRHLLAHSALAACAFAKRLAQHGCSTGRWAAGGSPSRRW